MSDLELLATVAALAGDTDSDVEDIVWRLCPQDEAFVGRRREVLLGLSKLAEEGLLLTAGQAPFYRYRLTDAGRSLLAANGTKAIPPLEAWSHLDLVVDEVFAEDLGLQAKPEVIESPPSDASGWPDEERQRRRYEELRRLAGQDKEGAG